MNQRKRPMALLCAALMLASLLACQAATAATEPKANFHSAGFPIVDEKIALSVLQFVRDVDNIDFENLWFYARQEEKTNIHIEFQPVKSANWTTKLNLMFASNEYADIILTGLNGQIDFEDLGVRQGLLLELDAYIEPYMPNYHALKQYDNVTSYLKASNGKQYYIGTMRADGKINDSVALINTKWLEAVGADVPQTIEELTEVLRKFKAEDPNGNGLADEVPYQAQFIGGVTATLASWGISSSGKQLMLSGDELVLIPDQQGYREWAEWVHLLYKEQLLDPEFLSQEQSVYFAKLESGISGYVWNGRTLNTGGLGDWFAEDFEVMLPPKAEGYEPLVSRSITLPSPGAALTIQNKHVEESLRWLDSLMEPETMIEAYWGPLDKTIYIDENGLYAEMDLPYAVAGEYCPAYNSMLFLPPTAYEQYRTNPDYIEQRNAFGKYYEDNGCLEPVSSSAVNSLAILTPDEKTRANFLKTELDTFVKENTADFILNGMDDAKWNKYVETLGALGAHEYLAIFQAGYDKYLALQE